MFSRMSIWMTTSRLFSGMIKFSAIDMFNFQFTYNSMTITEKSAPSFPGPLMPTRTDSWPSRSGDLGTKLSNCKIGSDFCAIWHLSFHHLCHTYYLLLKPLKVLFSRQTNYSSRQNSNNFAQISSPAALGQRRWRAQGEGGGLDKGDGGSIQVLEYKDTKEQK